MLLRRQLMLQSDEHLDLTPMVDVVFQLMTFLLLTYHAAGALAVDVPEARHGLGIEEQSATVLSLLPSETPGGPVRVYAGMDEEDELRLDTDQAIRDVVAAGLAEGRRRVVLQANQQVPHGEVLRIAAIVAEVEGIMLHIGVQEPE